MGIKVGIIGASFARAAYLPALRLIEGVEVAAIASARLESARAAADAFNVPHAYNDWQSMLSEHKLDLVCIATPTVTHAPMTLAALEAGAHVLCEKPTAMDAEEAKAMLDRAEALGRIHMLDHELRFNARRRRIKQLIESGSLGEIRHIAIHSFGTSWAEASSRPENDWWSLAEQGGGRLGANGSHQVDLLRWWFGEIQAVSGRVKTLAPKRRDPSTGRAWIATADDYVEFTAEFQSGAIANVLLSTVARHGLGNETHIFGSEGTISLSSDTERLLYGEAGSPLAEIQVPDPYASLAGINAGIWNQAVAGVLRELCSAILEVRPLREGATFLDGWRNQCVLDAIRKSERDKCWVSVSV